MKFKSFSFKFFFYFQFQVLPEDKDGNDDQKQVIENEGKLLTLLRDFCS